MVKYDETDIAALIAAIRTSTKYQAVSEDLIRTIGLRELTVRRNQKAAIKATKNKLHQVAGAYLDARPPYAKWREKLAALEYSPAMATPAARGALRQCCLDMLAEHASTRERLPILPTFYSSIFAHIPPVHSVLDLACGLNPLAIDWMPLASNASYYACDIYADMMAFLNDFFVLTGTHGQAQVCDLLTNPPRQAVDLALLLKALPPLEQVHAQAGHQLLCALNARYIIVSFPARSLGGRDRGMAEYYEQHFRTQVADEAWTIERFAFASELAFLVSKT